MKRRKIGRVIISFLFTFVLVLHTVVSANAADLICDDVRSDDLIATDVESLFEDDVLISEDDTDSINDLTIEKNLLVEEISDYKEEANAVIAQYNTNLDTIIEKAIEWGGSQLGSTNYDGRCQAFVWRCYNASGVNIGSYETANACMNALMKNTDINAPRGALVFFDKIPKDKYGHIGISLGNGKMIHAGHNGVEETDFANANNLSTWYKILYRGWGFPDSLNYSSTSSPIGHIDSISTDGEKLYVGGWGYDPDSPSKVMQVNVYIEGYGNPIASFNTHLYREIAGGVNCGFDETIDISNMKLTGKKKVSLWGIDLSGDENAEIGSEIVDFEDDKSPEIEDGDYVIMSALRYDLHLNIEGDDTSDDDDNVNVERGFYEDSKYDVFKVRLLDNGYYKLIQNKTNHMAVSVAGRSSSEDANIQMYYWNPEDLSNTEFQWAIEWAKKKDGVPYHYIRPRCSGLYMTAAGSSNGRNVYQASKDEEDDDCQKWFFARYMKPDIETNSLPKGEVGKSYSAKLEADSDFDVKWTFNSKNDSLPPGLSLDKAGKITGIPTQPGTYTFSLDAENLLVDALGYSTKQYTIIVSGDIPVNKIALNKETLELTKGNSETLIATVEPVNATNRKITWSSDNTAVATVDENGKITTVSEGTAKITASSNDGSDKSATCVVTVKPIPIPDGITIKADEVTGVAGKPISVPVRILGNTGLGSMALTITSDPALTLTGIERGDILKKGTFETDVKTGLVQWWTTSNSNAEGDGILFILKYDIKSDANIGKYPISVSCTGGIKENITDKESVTLDVTIIDGSLIIANIVIIPGDVTGNGMVAMDDVVKVARAASGNVKLTDAEKLAGDVTGDGVVAMGDVVKIARFVAKSIDKL